MTEQRVQRRLAAVLATDMVGYSRLMEADERGTIARQKTLRDELIDPRIAEHNGRIVKTTGDGLLVEFASVVDATECAVAVQRALAEREAEIAEDRRIQYRIGINLGDIVIEGDDIFGEGVNVAARLESIAQPGGICVSGMVREAVSKKLDLDFEDLGEKQVKNISAPVRVYAVRMATSAKPVINDAKAEKLSIAVLPFENMSGDPEQEFFADGLTEDILTGLSRFQELFVISRTSVFTYKGKSIRIKDIAQELGVRYILEGSVRKAGNNVRVTVQLIDAASDSHVWADRYDRKLDDIFAIQDEVTAAIVATLPGRIEASVQDIAQRKLTENMAAYELVLTGKVLHHRSDRNDNARALSLLDRAVDLDPGYAHGHAWRACVLGQAWIHDWCEDREVTEENILDALQTALALDENDSDVHRILAAVNTTFHDHDRAKYHQDKALSLNPNDDLVVVQHGELLTWLGQPEEGIEWIKKAMRLNPYHPPRFWNHLGRAYFVARRYDEAIEAFKHIATPDSSHHAFLAACCAHSGDETAAEAHKREVLKQNPAFTIVDYMETQHHRAESDRDHHRQGLAKAGLPA